MRSSSDRWLAAIVVALLLSLLAAIVRLAWISDDAYITLRSVENVLAGHGPVWNVGERVQTFSHALWFWLLTAARWLVGSHYPATIALSLLCVATTVALLLRLARTATAMIAVLTCLLASRAFGDYATSGLEAPLSMLLLATVTARLAPRELGSAVFEASWWTALLAMTRPDLILVAGPLLAVHLLIGRSWRAARLAALGFAPLLLWEAFSLFYYGSLVPVTAYAKAIAPGIPAGELFAQGLKYYRYVLQHDPATLLILAGGLGIALVRGRPAERLLALGGVLYCGYVLRIGGGFMAGRFFVPPFTLATLLLAAQIGRSERNIGSHALTAIAAALAFVPGLPPYLQPIANDLVKPEIVHGIVDERRFYYDENGMLSPQLVVPQPGLQSRELRSAGRERPLVVVADRAGKSPYEAGDLFHYIDPWLCDPLMMRLPIRHPEAWRIGHFTRGIPDGYLESLASGDNNVVHPGLHACYEDLRVALRAPLTSPKRLGAVLDVWLGSHRQGMQAYVDEHYRTPQRRLVEAAALPAQPWPKDAFWFDDDRIVVIGEGGARVTFAAERTASGLDLWLSPLVQYQLRLLQGERIVNQQPLLAVRPIGAPATGKKRLAYLHQLGGMHVFHIDLPVATTFDRLELDAKPLAQITIAAIGGIATN